jgi:hypothetical protein
MFLVQIKNILTKPFRARNVTFRNDRRDNEIRDSNDPINDNIEKLNKNLV